MRIQPAVIDSTNQLAAVISKETLAKVSFLRLTAYFEDKDLSEAMLSAMQTSLDTLLNAMTGLRLFEWHFYIRDGSESDTLIDIRPFIQSGFYKRVKSIIQKFCAQATPFAVRTRILSDVNLQGPFNIDQAPWRLFFDFPFPCSAHTTYCLQHVSAVSVRPVQIGEGFTVQSPPHEVDLLLPLCPSRYFKPLLETGNLKHLVIAIQSPARAELRCILACAAVLEKLSIIRSARSEPITTLEEIERFTLPHLRLLRLKFLPARICDTLLKVLDTPQLESIICCAHRPSLPECLADSREAGYLRSCPALRNIELSLRYPPPEWDLASAMVDKIQMSSASMKIMFHINYAPELPGMIPRGPQFHSKMSPDLRKAFQHITLTFSDFPATYDSQPCRMSYPQVTSLRLLGRGREGSIHRELNYIFEAFRLPALQEMSMTLPAKDCRYDLQVLETYLDTLPNLTEIVLRFTQGDSFVDLACPERFKVTCAERGIKAGVVQDFDSFYV